MTDLIPLLRERAEGYGALRKSSLTAIALDRAADEIAALREHVGALLAELDKTERRSCKAAGLARAALSAAGGGNGE